MLRQPDFCVKNVSMGGYMSQKHWYKIETNKEEEETYHSVGSSSLAVEAIFEEIHPGELLSF